MAERLFYYRLIDGDFYQKRSLERVIEMEGEMEQDSIVAFFATVQNEHDKVMILLSTFSNLD